MARVQVTMLVKASYELDPDNYPDDQTAQEMLDTDLELFNEDIFQALEILSEKGTVECTGCLVGDST